MALAPAECVLSSFLPPALKLWRTAEALAKAGRRPQDLAFRKALFQIHLWTGIGVGLYIFVVGLTGALLMFRSEMQQAAYPQFFHVAEAAGPTADIGTVLREFRSAYPDQTFSGIDTPTPTRQTFLTYVHKDGRYVAAFAHPATGKVLGELNPHSFVSRLQDLHFELLGGETGRTLNGIGAICLTALALTGLVIWWPGITNWRKGFRVDFSRSWKRITFDLHSAVGISTAVFVLIWGLSGAYFVFSRQFRGIVNAISPLTSAPPSASDPALKGRAPAPTIAAFVEKARKASPGSELVRVLLPPTDRAPLVVAMTHPGLSRADDDRGVSFYFDQFSGELLQTWDRAPRTGGDRFVAALAPLHLGMFGGLGVKILWAILGLAPSLLFATGSAMWWNRVVSDRWSKLKTHATAAAALFTVLVAGSSRDVFAQEAVFPVSHSGRGAYEASLTRLGDRFAVTWYDTRDGHAQIYLQVIDDRGRSSRPEQRLTNGPSFAYEPDVDAVDSNLAIAWYEKAADGPLTAKLGLWTKDGRLRWSKALSATGHNGRNPVVRASRQRIFCAWIENRPGEGYAVWAQWFDAQGRAAAPPRRLAPAGQTTWNLNAAIDDQGRAWVVFDARVGTRRNELFLVRVAGTRSMASDVVQLSADDGFNSKYPDIAFSGDRAALTWFEERDGNDEVYLFVAPTDDLKQGLEERAARVTDAPGESIGAYVAWNGGQVGLAWCDNTFGQHEIYVQRFDESGKPIDEPERLTRNGTWSLIPAIRSWRDGFALVWNEFTPGLEGTHGSDGRSEVVLAIVSGASRRIDARQPKQ